MHKYRVVEIHKGPNWLLLEGGLGKFHCARVLDKLPPVGSILSGSRPHLGFGRLVCCRSKLTYRLVFETINSEHRRFDTALIAEPLSVSREVPCGEVDTVGVLTYSTATHGLTTAAPHAPQHPA